MFTKKERDIYNGRRRHICEVLGLEKSQYNALRRLGERLRALYCQACNGEDEETEIVKLENKIIALSKSFELEVFFQTDPRGEALYADKKKINEISYTNSYCIY